MLAATRDRHTAHLHRGARGLRQGSIPPRIQCEHRTVFPRTACWWRRSSLTLPTPPALPFRRRGGEALVRRLGLRDQDRHSAIAVGEEALEILDVGQIVEHDGGAAR